MRTALLAVVLATGAALAAGGSLRLLPRGRPRWWWLVSLAVTVLVAAPRVPSAGVAPLVAVLALLAVFAGVNLQVVGMAVVLAGLGLNLAVIGANGAMPVDAGAVVAAGLAPHDEVGDVDLGPFRRWRGPGDHLSDLGDIVPVPVLDEVVSFGDLVLAAGLANVAFRLLRPRLSGTGPGSAPGRRRAARHRRGPLLSAPSPAR